MAPPISKKRKLEDALKGKPTVRPKKSRKPTHYSSPSPSPSSAGEDFAPVSLADSDHEDPSSPSQKTSPSSKAPLSPLDSDSDADAASDSSGGDSHDGPPTNPKRTRKANDPAAFSNAMAKILGSKLSTSKRADPVLARSATAQEANESISNARLEAKARQKLREDKKKDLERGRVRDVLLGTDMPKVGAIGSGERDGHAASERMSVGEMQELEKRLRKTAQRGVVKLFNAVRAAQVKGEEAARNAKSAGRDRKQERVGEMSKQGFLELVAGGGTTTKSRAIRAEIEEA